MSQSEESVNLLKHIRVVLFSENGRLLYQFKQPSASSTAHPTPAPPPPPAPPAPPATSRQSNGQDQSNSNNNVNQDNSKKATFSSRDSVPSQLQKSNLSTLSECIFGSVSIQSLPKICVSKIHQLKLDTIMMSLVFEIQQPQAQNKMNRAPSPTSSRSSSGSQMKETNRSHQTSSTARLQAASHRPGHVGQKQQQQQQQTIRKKFGLALIWESVEHQLGNQRRTVRDFILNYSKAIDFHFNVLKDHISSAQPLSSRLIHTYALNCLRSINSMANSLLVSNLKDFTEQDFVEEFVSLVEELELKTTNYTMSAIISVLLSSDQHQDLQIVLSSDNPDTKVLMLRILFVVRCLLFDKNLALSTSRVRLNATYSDNQHASQSCKQNAPSGYSCNRSNTIKDQCHEQKTLPSSSYTDQPQRSGMRRDVSLPEHVSKTTSLARLSDEPQPSTSRSHLNETRRDRSMRNSKSRDTHQQTSGRSIAKVDHQRVSTVSKEKLSSSYDNKDAQANNSSTYDDTDKMSSTMLAKSKLYIREYQSLRFSGPSSLPHSSSISSTFDGSLSRSASGSATNISQEFLKESPHCNSSDMVSRKGEDLSTVVRTNISHSKDSIDRTSDANTLYSDVTGEKNEAQTSSDQTSPTATTITRAQSDQINISNSIRPLTIGAMTGFAELDMLETKSNLTSSPDSRNLGDQTKITAPNADGRADNLGGSFCEQSYVSASSGTFEIIKDPKTFKTKPLIYIIPNHPNLCKIYEPVITNQYLISCALQCIITGQMKLVNERLTLETNKDRILHIDCDNWSSRIILNGISKTVVLSSVIMEICNAMKQMKLLKVDGKLIIEYFYSRLTEVNLKAIAIALSLHDLSLDFHDHPTLPDDGHISLGASTTDLTKSPPTSLSKRHGLGSLLSSQRQERKPTNIQLPQLYHKLRLDFSDLNVIRTLCTRNYVNTRHGDCRNGYSASMYWNLIRPRKDIVESRNNNRYESILSQKPTSDNMDSIFYDKQLTRWDHTTTSSDGHNDGEQEAKVDISSVNQNTSVYSSRASAQFYLRLRSKCAIDSSETCL